MTYHEALLSRALASTLEPDDAAFMRRVKRFYSKAFHVPLPDVDDLEEEHVLVAYFEELCEMLPDEEREELRSKLIETPEERVAREALEKEVEVKDEEFLDNLAREVKDGKRRELPKERPKLKMPAQVAAGVERMRAIKERIRTGVDKPPPVAPPPPAAAPDIHMDFGSNLGGIPDEWGNLDPTAPAPKK